MVSVKPVLSSITPGGSPAYRLVVKDSTKISEEEFLDTCTSMSGLEKPHCRFLFDIFRDTFFRMMGNNCSIDLGFAQGKLYVTGSLKSVGDQPDPKENQVVCRVHFKGPLADKISSIEAVNEVETVNVVIHELWQDGVSEPNRIVTAADPIVINGNCLYLPPGEVGTGVWLQNSAGIVVQRANIINSDHSSTCVNFDALPPTGQYTLCFASRDGNDPERYVACIGTRKVQVVNG